MGGLKYIKNTESVDVAQRINLHSLPIVSANYVKEIDKQLSYIRNILSENKHDTFFSSIRLPLYTTKIVNKIIKRNKKIFSGKNPSITVTSTETYIKKAIDIVNKDIEELKLNFYNLLYHNSQDVIIVNIVDGIPKYQVIPVSAIIEIKEKDNEILSIEYKIKLDDKTDAIAIIDENKYTTIIDDQSSSIDHKLKYCPAFYVEGEGYNDVRNGILLNSLSDLDWLLFFSISKRLGDLSGAFPIISVYEEECDYSHEDIECKKGVLVSNTSGILYDQFKSPMKCPVCSNRKFVGYGTILKMTIPEKDQVNLMPPINVTPGDIPSLEFCTKEIERIENSIFKDLTGYEIEIPQAINEKQVQAMFEQSKTIINDIARKVERIINKYFQIVFDFTYGLNVIKSIKYSFGTEFYIYSENELLTMYLELRDKGSDTSILDNIYFEYLATKYKNNLEEYNKQKTLFELDTFRHMTIDQVKALILENYADKKELILKLRKTELLQGEDYNDPLLKIKLTKKIIEKYGKDMQNNNPGN